MTSWIWIALAGVGMALIAMFFLRKTGSPNAMAAARSGDVSLLVASLAGTTGDDAATRWDNAISDLWKTYHRETAAEVVVQAAQHSDADIIQYWIAQVIQVEPDIAREKFSQEFLMEHFRPDVATRCGRKGCCG